MNAERRKAIRAAEAIIERALGQLSEAKGILDDVLSEEQDAYDNLPEAMQNTQRGELAQLSIQNLETAIDALDAALDGDVMSALEEARA
jgi:hypothetical protein